MPRPQTEAGHGRTERGAVAVLVALVVTALLVTTAMVLDFGIVRLDRQKNKAVADAAATAGLRGMDGGDGNIYSYKAVCQALDFLKGNEPALSGLTWAPCSDPALLATKCVWGTTSTYAAFTGSANGIAVRISNPYDLSASASEWPEESLDTLQNDQMTTTDSCNHLAVVVRQTRQPGLGSLVVDGPIGSSVRSVGRVQPGDDADVAVALVVLERTSCRALHVEGSNARIHVLGNGPAPGLIHVDSLGNDASSDPQTGCFSDNEVINVNSNTNQHAVVAHRAQSAGLTGVVEPGQIGVYGLQGGSLSAEQASDEIPRVYAGPYPPGTSPVGRDLLTRRPVHAKYAAGVSTAMNEANDAWTTPNAAQTVSGSACGGNSGPPSPTAAGVWYFDCDEVRYNTNVVLPNASAVIIRGTLTVEGSNSFSLPRATRVYINKPSSSATRGITVKGGFRMHTRDADGSTACGATTAATTRARLVIGKGNVYSEGSTPLFRACDTSVIMMGGTPTGCVPSDATQAPQESTSCTSGSINLAGNATTDWTAPDLRTTNRTDADLQDLEDLALWTESEAESSIAGGGGMTLAGVFALPNAKPFNIGGGGTQDVRDSQYFTRRLYVRGNGTLELAPNPYNVITVPYLGGFELVR